MTHKAWICKYVDGLYDINLDGLLLSSLTFQLTIKKTYNGQPSLRKTKSFCLIIAAEETITALKIIEPRISVRELSILYFNDVLACLNDRSIYNLADRLETFIQYNHTEWALK